MRKIFLVGLAFVLTTATQAQKTKKEKKEERRERINALIKQEEEGVIAYHKHTAFGIRLASDGYGVFMEIGRAQSINKGLLFQLDISERKSQKENKRTYNGTAPFILGKQNFIYNAKLGVQQQILLGNKSNKNGVAVTANFGGGLAVGFIRPYYVQLPDQSYVKYDSEDSSKYFSNVPFNVVGGPGISKGWDEMEIRPGVYAKGGFRFDYGRYNETISALEVGIAAEYYGKEIVQMIYDKPRQFFFSGYVALVFGKRK